jgi:spermidine synthase
MTYNFFEKDQFSPINYNYSDVVEIYNEKSQFQKIQVLEHPFFGRMLVLDGIIQLTTKDEFFYHEMLVHPAMITHPHPREAIIIGGGDGGCVREVLKHPEIDSVTLVEMDIRVIEVCQEFFPMISAGINDQRVKIVSQDGLEYLENGSFAFDVVIVDSTDPIGPAKRLFSERFYSLIEKNLNIDGVFVTQSESLFFHLPHVIKVQQNLKNLFKMSYCYTQALSTYAGNWWTFSIASKLIDPRKVLRQVDGNFRYYSPEVHMRAFLPDSIQNALVSGKLDW